MLQLTTLEIIIRSPVSAVYSYMIDHTNYKNWYPQIISVTPTDNLPTGVPGKSYLEKIRISKSRCTEFIVEIKEATTDKAYAMEAEWQPLMTRLEVDFTTLSRNETRINLSFFSRSQNFWIRLLARTIIKRLLQRQTATGLNNLKAILEDHSSLERSDHPGSQQNS